MHGRWRRQGFSLVVSVTVLLLLAVVALGMLTLSSLTVRTATAGGAESEARANARLALLLAMGELQKSLGPDQRISANGSILVEGEDDSAIRHPHWTGVWDSWKAGELDRGDPKVDGYSRHQTIAGRNIGGMHPTYEPRREDHFRSWLVSLRPEEAGEIASAGELALPGMLLPAKDAEGVQLVGKGSLGTESDAADHVSARLLEVDTGRYAWWIGDESQKARIMHDSFESGEGLSLAEQLFRHQAPGSTGTTTIAGLEELTEEGEAQLAGLPSLRTVDLVEGATDRPSENFHAVTPFSYQVLADVREGGLKRDLTTLLERPLRQDRAGMPRETGEEYMLYKFDTKDQWAVSNDSQECVPIHDLAAYYQLYDGNRNGWKKGGVQYSSSQVRGAIHAMAPDFGSKQDSPDTYLREYTSLYRHPVPIKVQFLLSMYAAPRSRSEITRTSPDTHKLRLAITPAVTLWNPSNLPIVMNLGDPNRYAYMFRLMNMPINVRWIKNGGEYKSDRGMHMTWATQQAGGFKANVFSLYFSGTRQITFEPGEVRVFSLPYRAGNMAFRKTDWFTERHEVEAGWDPTGFLELHRSDRNGGSPHVGDNCLLFSADDQVAFEVSTDNTEIYTGAGMKFFMIQASYQQHGQPGRWDFRHYHHISRVGRGDSTSRFNSSLYSTALPGRGGIIRSAARSGRQIIARSGGRQPEPWPFLYVGLMAGCETHEGSNGGSGAGRKFASRPFLHSTAIAPSFIDRSDHDSFYNYGWNWWVEEINSVWEAPVQVGIDDQTRSYYGGGYTPESGSTHVVQQEIPVVPPMSIASLSHAHLGGFSLATVSVAPGYQGLTQPFTNQSWQHVTATGQAGLFPHTLQAIGNSYAHPHIPADEAYTDWMRHYSEDDGQRQTTLADHSYLANKALWDEFFFSSLSPQPSGVKVFDSRKDLDAEEVAEEFFFGETPLPNRRMKPYRNNLDEGRLGDLFKKADDYQDGLADRIAAHLMVEGPFNVNSTSVEAWKVFLSSLKGKSVAYLDKDKALTNGIRLKESTPEGTPVASFTLPNGEPREARADDPQDPEQWFGWRELTDDEIDELAEAIVQQVKLRGPFLSLSEFVNRRLDRRNKELAVKGALQAALDDRDVSINEGFRSPARKMGSGEIAKLGPAFEEALEGPVAYGSAAYVDQADVLRHFAAQLTPRGDTFVIRTYGDSLDAAGNVRARAWCEAVVQRVPDYLDPADESHLPYADLESEANKSFGRQLRVVSFRWLKQSEV